MSKCIFRYGQGKPCPCAVPGRLESLCDADLPTPQTITCTRCGLAALGLGTGSEDPYGCVRCGGICVRFRRGQPSRLVLPELQVDSWRLHLVPRVWDRLQRAELDLELRRCARNTGRPLGTVRPKHLVPAVAPNSWQRVLGARRHSCLAVRQRRGRR
jgi:hypothetical protein